MNPGVLSVRNNRVIFVAIETSARREARLSVDLDDLPVLDSEEDTACSLRTCCTIHRISDLAS